LYFKYSSQSAFLWNLPIMKPKQVVVRRRYLLQEVEEVEDSLLLTVNCIFLCKMVLRSSWIFQDKDISE